MRNLSAHRFLWTSLVPLVLCGSLVAQRSGGGARPGAAPQNGGTVQPPVGNGGNSSGGGHWCPGGGGKRPPVVSPAPSGYTGPGTPSRPGAAAPRTGAPSRPRAGQPGTGGPLRPKMAHPSWFLPTTQESVKATDWNQWWVWWSFNRDAYLSVRGELERRPDSHPAHRRDGIGTSEEIDAAFQQQAAHVFSEMTREGDMIPILSEALIAGARTSAGTILDRQVKFAADLFGKLKYPRLKNSAVLSLGIRGSDLHIDTLQDIFRDTTSGRELLDVDEVSDSLRAMAAFSLGMAAKNLNEEQRVSVARVLMDEVLLGLGEARIAAALALGLVELPRCSGPSAGDAPHTCPGTQIDILVEAFLDPQAPVNLRAHVLTSIARLAGEFDNPDRRQSFVDLLLEQTRSHNDDQLTRSAIIALGLFGDCDSDAADVAVRKELVRLIHVGPKEFRGLAMISLAQVSARRIDNDNLKETAEILVRVLARGKGEQKSWAALALGVLGSRSAYAGHALDRSVAFGLRERLFTARTPSLAAACSLGLALLHNDADESRKVLARRYAKSEDPFFHSYAALALGVLSVTEATDDLKEAAVAGDMNAALALRILGDDEIVPQMIEFLSQPKHDRAALIRMLGRSVDARAIAPLANIMKDKAEDTETRALAAKALGELVDTDFGHWTASYANDLNYRALTGSLSDPTTQQGLLDFRPRE